ncbi:hypothetical protein DFH09DRAFT_1165903 [Mycena vulgaris]|nr:hypothetical protein DFH09DRAFT_1165903 [Mycena vulgaris]
MSPATSAVSQVSAYWRKIATTTPQLWTGLFVLDVRVGPTDVYLEALKLWLNRSSSLSISVSVTSSLSSVNITPLIRTLITGANRWSDLTLYVGSLWQTPLFQWKG